MLIEITTKKVPLGDDFFFEEIVKIWFSNDFLEEPDFEVRQDDFEELHLFSLLPDEMQEMYNEGCRKFRHNYTYDLHMALKEVFQKTLDEINEPDYDNMARDYEDAQAWSDQPTPYDP